MAGTTYTDTFPVASADGTLTSVPINITGTNDAAVLSSATANLTEANSAAAISTSGSLTISDVDSAATFVTAFVPTNSTSYFGRSAGGFYLQDATVTKSNGAWNEVETEFESEPLIA